MATVSSTLTIKIVSSIEEKNLDARIKILGRQRPASFKSAWAEVGFCIALLGSMMISEYFISGFNIILPILATALNIPAQSQTWPASVFSLITGAFLLPFGRLADIYGGKRVFILGLTWFLIWTLITGFSQNYLMLIVCRALQGLGPAAFLPAGIVLLGSTYRPGPRKNMVFSLYGACSPIGFFSGIFFAGLTGQYIPWGAYFWIGSALLCVVTIIAVLTVPSDEDDPGRRTIMMDWYGTVTIVPGLILLCFAITDGSHAPQGWRTSYIYVSFILGVAFLCAAFCLEGWVAKMPLLPADIFEVRHIKSLTIALFFSYGAFGIYLFYASFYIENVLGASSLQTIAWFAPMAIGGIILSAVGGFVLHVLPGTVLLVTSGAGYLISMLLFAIAPEDVSYWAYVFPAMICATIGVDITFNVANVFITTAMPKARQGLAGALINTVIFLSISFFLGVADVSVSATVYLGQRQSYQVAFWLGVACSGISLLCVLIFVRIQKAKSDLTVDEKFELEAELVMRTVSGSIK